MTSYVFDQIDPANPPRLDFVSNSDQVIFHGGAARQAVVSYAVVNGEAVTTVAFNGHAVGFDPGIQIAAAHKDLIFDDGSNLMIGGPRDEAFDGGAGDDGMYGGAGNDTLNGHAGANFLQGNQGADSLVADVGADTILGGQGNDVISAGPVSGEPNSAAGDVVNGNLGDDNISAGVGSDTLLGGQGDDAIFGDAGQDYLNGNLGDDRLIADGAASMFGEAGADTLTARGVGAVLNGGAGADAFGIFIGGLSGFAGVRATIADWASEDSIAFSHVAGGHAYAESQAADLGGALAEATRLSTAAADPDGAVVVVQVGHDLYAFATPLAGAAPTAAVLIVGRTLADIGADDFIT